MSVPVRIATVAVALALTAAPAAAAPRTYCVRVQRADCEAPVYDTLADALAAAAPDDRILVDAGPEPGFDDGGKAVHIVGDMTRFTSAVTLAAASLEGARLPSLTATGPVHLSRAQVGGAVVSQGGALRLDDADVGGGIEASCGTVDAHGVTVAGGVDAACDAGTAAIALDSSVVLGAKPFSVGENATVSTDYSVHADDPSVTRSHWLGADAGLDDQDRPRPGSPVVDAGDPAPWAAPEPLYDLADVPRIADGNGDGTPRRDAGAYELQPPPVAPPAGNVLADPDAESGLTGWTGTFATAAYGSDDYLPTKATAAALGAGTSLFSGSADTAPALTQRIDVVSSAASIDAGGAAATLSGLLGGYGSDPDEVSLQATFLDPEGNAIGTLAVPGVSAADRASDTNLLARSVTGPIPPRTRFIDVRLGGRRVGDGVYTDAYADNLALVLSVPGVPAGPQQQGPRPTVPGLKPFAGITVLTPHMTFGRSGRSHVTLACASATVGACAGTLEFRGRLPKAPAASRIAHYVTFSVPPGRRAQVPVVMLVAARQALARRTKLPITILATAHDGQGLQRRRVVPLNIKLPAALRARRGRGTPGTAGAPAPAPAAR